MALENPKLAYSVVTAATIATRSWRNSGAVLLRYVFPSAIPTPFVWIFSKVSLMLLSVQKLVYT